MLVTERFKLNPLAARFLQGKDVNFGFGLLGHAMYLRTYSRIKEDGTQENWADTVIRTVEGVMSILKTHRANNKLDWNESDMQELAMQMAMHIFEFKFLPPGRGLWAGGTEHVFEHGSMALNNPLSGDTGVITSNGIIPIERLVGSSFSVLTAEGWKPATARCYGEQQVQEIVLAPMYKSGNGGYRKVVNGKRRRVVATPDHGWPIVGNTKKEHDLSVGQIVLGASSTVSETQEYEAGFRHGLVFADGAKNRENDGTMTAKYQIRLCGDKAKYVSYFEGEQFRVTYPDSYGGDPYINFTSAINMKNIPDSSTADYAAGFIRGWLAGDGTKSTLSSQNSAALDWLEDHAPYAGYVVTGRRIDGASQTNYGTRSANLEVVRLTEAVVGWEVESILPLQQKIPVYCLTVPDVGYFVLAGGIYTGNCGFTSVRKLSEDAAWAMNALMLGVGVGYDTFRSTVNLKEPTAEGAWTYQIPDSREGWVESLRLLIESYEKGLPVVNFDYSIVRPKGMPIKGFGGIASGPGPLRDLHETLRNVLGKRARKEISSVRCISDVINLVAKCVVSGNVRRSALIALGRADDEEFMNLKNWHLPENAERLDFSTGWGFNSNNSIVLENAGDFDVLPKLAPLVSVNAEPGVLNLMNVQKYARRGEKKKDRAIGVNPCGEIALEDKELCNLVEVFPTRCHSESEFLKAIELATQFASIVSLLETESSDTNEVIERNRRIGVSISGIVDWLAELPNKSDFVRLMNEGYEIVKAVNAKHAVDNKVPASIRLTTVKPSGTISLLAGVSPGMHHAIFRRYIRRTQVAADSPLVEILSEAGIPYEPDMRDENAYLFEFPVEVKNIRPQDEVSLHEHGMRLLTIGRFWADNAASNTSTFKATLYENGDGEEINEFMHPDTAKMKGYKVKIKGEEDSIESFLTYLLPDAKSVSMSPTSQSRSVYPQSPYESITIAEYEKRMAMIKPVDWSKFQGSDGSGERFCTNDSCEI